MTTKSCPSRDELSGYVRGTLPPSQADALGSHVAACPMCENTIHDLASDTDPLLRQIKAAPAPQPYVDEEACRQAVASVERRGREAGAARPAPSSISRSTPAAGAAAASPSEQVHPMTYAEFVDLVTGAGLVSADELATIEKQLAPAEHRDVQSLARVLVHQHKLTKYQAAAVYQGKTKSLVYGDYLVLDRIGAGGMGQVFKARHRRMDRVVALKVITAAALGNADAVKRFEREVKAAAKLIHPNIVTAFDAGLQDGQHYLVMEFVDGTDLSSHLKRQGKLAARQACEIIAQAARGLAFAHAKGVVHRDIKPGNLLVGGDGAVKILDLGLARFDDEPGALRGAREMELTQSGAVMGTIDYMAPEQALNTRLADAKSDVYGLGCTLYRLLTGVVPYRGDTMVEKILAHREHPIPSVRAQRPDASPAVEALITRMMAKRPEDRPTMQEVADALTAIDAGAASGSGIGLAPVPTASAVFPPSAIYPPAASAVYPPAAPPVGAPTAMSFSMPPTRPAPFPATTAKSTAAPPRRRSNLPLLLVGAAGVAAAVAFGVWVKIRDPQGNLVGQVQVPEGGSVVIESSPGPGGAAPPKSNPPEQKTDSADASDAPGKPIVNFNLPATVITPTSPSNVTPPPAVNPPPSSVVGDLWVYVDPIDRMRAGITVDGIQFDGSPLTIEAWCLPDVTPSVTQLAEAAQSKSFVTTIFGFGDRILPQLGLRRTVRSDDSAPAGWGVTMKRRLTDDVDDKNFNQVALNVNVPAVQRTHLALVVGPRGNDGRQEVTLFVDGKQRATENLPLRSMVGEPFVSDGFFDELRISKIARYAADFTPSQHFTTDADTLGLYHCDEGSGNRLVDASGNNRHAALTAARWAPYGAAPGTPVAAVSPSSATPAVTIPMPSGPSPVAASGPSPLDALRRDAIPSGVLSAVGFATLAEAPPELVYVLRGRQPPLPTSQVSAVSPDISTFVIGTANGQVRVMDALRGTERALAKQGDVKLHAIAFSHDGKSFAVAGREGVVGLWDSQTGVQKWASPPTHGVIQTLAFSPDDLHVAYGNEPKKVVFLDITDGRTTLTIAAHKAYIHGVAFSPDGRVIASGAYDKSVKLWDAQSGQLLGQSLEGHTERVNTVAYSPDGRTVASGGADPAARFWDVATQREVAAFTKLTEPVSSIAFHPTGQTAAIATEGGSVYWVRWQTGEVLRSWKFAAFETYVRFDPTGRYLAASNQVGTLWILRLTGGSPIAPPTAVTSTPPPVSTPPADPTLVCARLAAKSKPIGLVGGAIEFDCPPGDGRSGANGFIVTAPQGWQTQGTIWSCDYVNANCQRGLTFVHPFRGGHVRVLFQKTRADVFPGAPGSTDVNEIHKGTSQYPAARNPNAAVFPLVDERSYSVSSQLDSSGNYRLVVDNVPIIIAQFAAVQPLGLKPPFDDPRCPATLGVGQAAMIVGPRDAGRNEASNIRLVTSSGRGVPVPPPAVGVAPPPVTSSVTFDTAPAEKRPVPETKLQQEALKTVKSVFEADYAAARTPDQKIALAAKLWEQAQQSMNDSTARYVLLVEARTVASDAGDLRVFSNALSAQTKEYAVDAVATRIDAWTEFLRRPRDATTYRALYNEANADFDDAVRGAEFDVAKRYGDFATTTAARLKDAALSKATNERNAALVARRKEWEVVDGAADKLAATPDDAEANLIVGRYLALSGGDWPQALKLLAKGSDATLKSLSEKSQTLAVDGIKGQVAAGDAWYDAAQAAKAPQRPELLSGMTYWYSLALPSLAGLERARVEKRVTDAAAAVVPPKIPVTLLPASLVGAAPGATTGDDLNKGVVPTPFTIGDPPPTPAPSPPNNSGAAAMQNGAFDLLSLVQLPRDVIRGRWSREGTKLIVEGSDSRAQIPFAPPGDEYDIVLQGQVTRRQDLTSRIQLGLVAQGRQFYVQITRGTCSISDDDIRQPPNYVEDLMLELDLPFTVLYAVRKDGIRYDFNGETVFEFRGDFNQLSVPTTWSIPRKDQLFMSINGGIKFEISSLTFRPAR